MFISDFISETSLASVSNLLARAEREAEAKLGLTEGGGDAVLSGLAEGDGDAEAVWGEVRARGEIRARARDVG